jgi:hydrophobic/amphiphilic exporter-1 (mainly G- bacteria), HAE1 family
VIEFFLHRPIFASVCSILILLAGIICMPILPIAQFPKIAPPVVTVQATYIGASAQAVESTVTTPLEEAINGVQGLRYISSQSTNEGAMTITCTFDLDRDLDRAADDVQNAVNTTLARLPAEVTQTGVTVTKNSGSFVLAMGLSSRDPNTTALFLSNYADLYIKNILKRVPGVSDVIIFGERKYAMRLWLDPKRLADNGLVVGDVTAALGDQNVQVAAGSLGQPPILSNQPYQISLLAQGRLSTPEQFDNLILKAVPNGGFVRLRDVGRVELGAENYAQDLHFDGRSAVGLGVQALPTSNALDVSKGVRAAFERLQKKFPPGMYYEIAFDSTAFVNESIKEVVITLLFAIALVILVIYLFLQDWHTTLIPAITIPISLLGTFALMKFLGFSINTLTLFGLTLATGLVVDDAIVVIENISRFIVEKGMSPFEGARAAMREISGAVIATSLVLLAVFVPVAFFPGTTGQLYKQFALTIACSVTISLFNALTLTPALSSLLLGRSERPHGALFDAINVWIDRMRRTYHDAIPNLISLKWWIIASFLCALAGTGYLFTHTSTGFTPDEDQGFIIVTVQAPEGASLAYTEHVTTHVEAILRQRPEVRDIFDINGFGFTGNGSNYATMFVRLQPWDQRRGYAHSIPALLNSLYPQFGQIAQAQIFAFNLPSIQGVGNFGGFQYELQDTGNVGLAALMGTAYGYMGMGNRNPMLRNVFTTFRNDTPQLMVDVDRQKVKSLGIPLADVFGAMQVELGSLYVNDFDYLNRSYRVYVQADAPFRSRIDDLQGIFVRSSSGTVVPLTGLLSTHEEKAAPIIYHYDLFRSIELNGQAAPGHGSGDAIAAMEGLSKQIDPPGVSHEWSGISLDEIESGALSALIFALGIVVVYLVLAAQYESFIDPFIILTAVPLAILGALLAMAGRNLLAAFFPGVGFVLSDVYAQVGFVMLIGLASKNAILIVEFANQLRRQGLSVADAARKAAETRLRPILMTSFAFILGILPLVFAGGAGSASRHSLGTPVFGGMILSTFLNLIVVPVLYVIIVNRFEKGADASAR